MATKRNIPVEDRAISANPYPESIQETPGIYDRVPEAKAQRTRTLDALNKYVEENPKPKPKKGKEKGKGLLGTLFGWGENEEEAEEASEKSDDKKETPKGILESAKEIAGDAKDWAGDTWVGQKLGEAKEDFAIHRGAKPDFEKYKGHADAQMSVIDQRILRQLEQDHIAAGKTTPFNPKSYTPEEREAARKKLTAETADDYLNEDFQKKYILPYAAEKEKSLAEQARQEKAAAWDQTTSDAIRAVTAPREKEYLKTTNFAGDVRADSAGLQGILSSRGNQLANQNLKLTA